MEQAKFAELLPKMENDDLIEQVLLSRSWSLERLAETIGYEARTLRRVQRGEIGMSPKLAKILSRQLGAPQKREPSLPNLEKSLPPLRRVYVAGWAEAGEARRCEEITDDEDFIEIRCPQESLSAVRIIGDSMEPEIKSGDVLVLSCDDRPQHGDVVVARLRDEGVVCKRIQVVDPTQGEIRLMSSNPDYVPMHRSADQIVWVYPVIRLIRNLR